MWFRNLQLYRLVNDFPLDAEALHSHLSERVFKPCGGLDTFSVGWAPPAGRETTPLVHSTNGRLMICARREDRLLPATVISEQVEERATAISAAEQRPVGRKERRQLRDEVVVDLLPRAFTRSHYRHAYIDPAARWIIVDSGTARQAEELLSLLRETLGTLRAKPLAVGSAPAAVLTRWLEDQPPEGFELGDECELKEPVENGAVVRGRRVDLAGGDVSTHLDGGLQVGRVAVAWQDRISCLLCDDLGIRRLRFLDLVMNEAAEVDTDDELARFDADFALMGMELARFLPAVIDAYGGIDEA
jgi:recombination associated protein RdgC